MTPDAAEAPGVEGAAAVAAAVRAGRETARGVLVRHVARHAATHPRLNALVQPRHEAAAGEAGAVDADPRAAGPLAGVPVSVKDCFPVSGLRTTLGITARAGIVDAADAEIVTRLRRAGAIVVGKSNVPQALFLHETDNPVFGRSANPLAADRGPGGSGGGDAALVAAGVVSLGVGTDVAGSLRQPAHACGVAALMPRTTVLGEAGAWDTLPDVRVLRPRAGFVARDVADLALALGAVLGDGPPGEGGLRRVAWWDAVGPIPPSPAVRRGVAEAVAKLRRAGVETTAVDPRLADEAAWLHLAIVSAGGGRHVRRLLEGSAPIAGVRRLLSLAGLPRRYRSVVAAVARLVGSRIEARGLLATGPRTADELVGLVSARETLAAEFAAALAGCDAVVCPVSAVPALRHGSAARLVLAAAPCLVANLLDLAAGAVPVTAVRADEQRGRPASFDPVLRAAAATDRGSLGLPIAVQVIAAPGRGEATVLEAMRLITAA